MEVWQIVLASIAYYGIGCIVANKVCVILREDVDLIICTFVWPAILLVKILTLPFK